ncbi:flagellar hook assembly protein FlgD [Pseudoalteromonas sp.]|uniref:flagellar hook assembly protein FlgD n=1 Tax=Pseudoalteromonas sp. TaxID=53249 RepID=UPI0035685EDD
MTNNISNDSYIDSLKWQKPSGVPDANNNDQLTQADFFALLTQQLSFQDPTKPADNDQMIAQMTSFSMADGISKLNTNFESFASSMTSNSALQASTLVGKDALVPSTVLELTDGKTSKGSVALDAAASDVTVKIKNAAGEVVRTLDIGSKSAGAAKFDWDGKDQSGNPLPPGNYAMTAEGRVADGKYVSFPTGSFLNISSVSLKGTHGLVLNTSAGPIKLSDVVEIAQG